MKIAELKTEAEMRMIWPLIQQLNPDLTRNAFERYLKVMLKNGYRCIVAKEDKKILGATGFWTGTRFWCGPYLEVDNVVVDQRLRSKGIGKAMMEWMEKEARRLKCRIVKADSYAHNTASHRFYFRERYIIRGFVFTKEMQP